MTRAKITIDPVPHVDVIDTPSGPVGYLIFNEHITGAEQALIDAVASLMDRNIIDLIWICVITQGERGKSRAKLRT